MESESKCCSFVGRCYADGSEVCGNEVGFGNCWVCVGGEMEYRPYTISANYPERL